VDVQTDIVPGSSLAVSAGNEVVPALRPYVSAFEAHGLSVYATRD
jgi:nicotinamidase/pyrazinamidase